MRRNLILYHLFYFMKTVYKAYKFRAYPNKEQKQFFEMMFGCCRLIWNELLNDRIQYYEKYECSLKNDYTSLLPYYSFLDDCDSHGLQCQVEDLNQAYKNFFQNREHFGFPKFKSKKNNYQSYTTRPLKHTLFCNKIKLRKIGYIKVKACTKNIPEIDIKYITVEKLSSGKYYIVIIAKETIFEKESTGNCIGFDLGIKDLLITSEGQKFDNITTLRKYEKQLVKLQRQLSRKTYESKRYEKQRIKVAKLYEKIANVRNDYLNKISTQLINENQIICCEDLKISNMVKNHTLAKSIEDCSWGSLIGKIAYKADWNDRSFIKISTFYPSSKSCNKCGYKYDDLTLDQREWECPICHTKHDRDINAAKNILKEGLRIYNS